MAGADRAGRAPRPSQAWIVRGLALLGGAGAAGLAAGVALGLRALAGVTDSALVLLVGVLGSAIAFGLQASLFTCLLSVCAYDFFFLPPLYSFGLDGPEEFVRLSIFAVVAIVVSNLAARIRNQTATALLRAKTTESLHQFSGKLADAASSSEVLEATAEQVSSMLSARIAILVQGPSGLEVQARAPAGTRLAESELATATWVWRHGRPMSSGAASAAGGAYLFVPMQPAKAAIGVVAIARTVRNAYAPLLNAEQDVLLRALCDQASVALERVNLADDIRQARLRAETDQFRAALLASISHDLRTPLASILGCATSLSGEHPILDPRERTAMLTTIREEAERLNRFIGNLLDMTRLESGALPLASGLADLSDIVGAVLRRVQKILDAHRVVVHLEPGLPMLCIDVVLFEQVLFNLLDNASKYSPPGARIELNAAQAGNEVQVKIIDSGEGIRPGDLDRVFEKFYRSRKDDGRPAGTGLGLAICRGFVEAMQGRIFAENRLGQPGAVFTIAMPVPVQLALTEEDSQ